MQDQRLELEELLRKLDEFQRTSPMMFTETRHAFEAMMRMVQNRLTKADLPQE